MPTIVDNTRPNLTRDERDLLAAISRYCRQAGWRFAGFNGNGDFVSPDLSLDVDWWSYHRGASTVLHISNLSRYGAHTTSICTAEIGSVREAVDIAVAYGLLPQNFFSAYRATAPDAMFWTGEVELRADQVQPGWLIVDFSAEGADALVVKVDDCADQTCPWHRTCVAVTAGGHEPVHFATWDNLQVRIPAGEL